MSEIGARMNYERLPDVVDPDHPRYPFEQPWPKDVVDPVKLEGEDLEAWIEENTKTYSEDQDDNPIWFLAATTLGSTALSITIILLLLNHLGLLP